MAAEQFLISDLISNLMKGRTKQSICMGTDQSGFELHELVEGKSCGVQMLTLRCGDKSVDVLPTRGMGIWQAHHRGIRFGWHSPVDGPVHPSFVPLEAPSGLGWLEGFDELMVRCGLCSNGAPEFDENHRLKSPLHGRIANLPARDVRVAMDSDQRHISVSGTVTESRFLFHRWELKTTISLDADSNEIQVVDRVRNLSDRRNSFQLLYHCNFGPPVLESGSQIFIQTQSLRARDSHCEKSIHQWNTVEPPTADFSEVVYFAEPVADQDDQCTALLTNQAQNLGAYVRFNVTQLPCFTWWKNLQGLNDGYVVGMEPGTNYPNPRSVEERAGRVVEVAPGGSFEIHLAIGMLVDPDSVAKLVNNNH